MHTIVGGRNIAAFVAAGRTGSILPKGAPLMVPAGKKGSQGRSPRRKRAPVRNTTSVLDLVRAGVERFVLGDANMMSFQKAIRTAAKRGENSTHPLTGAAFRRIVKEAMRKRKIRLGRSTRGQTTSGGEGSQ